MNHVNGVHDAQADFDGNLWFTYAHPGFDTTVGGSTPRPARPRASSSMTQSGYAIGSHGMTRDENGYPLVQHPLERSRGHGGLGKIDPKTDKVTVYLPPTTMSGTAGTLDADLNGNVWITSPDGAFRFDIAKEKFTEFKSITYKNERGTATVYGLAADRTGNGWWLLMQQDLIDYSDIKTGKTGEFSCRSTRPRWRAGRRRADEDVRDLRAAGLQYAVRVGAGAAPHGRRQERRLTSGSAIRSAATSPRSTSIPRR